MLPLRQSVETLDLRVNCHGLALLLVKEDEVTRLSGQEDVLNTHAEVVSEVHPRACVESLTDEDPAAVGGDVAGDEEFVLEDPCEIR